MKQVLLTFCATILCCLSVSNLLATNDDANEGVADGSQAPPARMYTINTANQTSNETSIITTLVTVDIIADVAEIEVYNTNGQLMYKGTVIGQYATLNTSYWAKGQYFIYIKTNDNYSVKTLQL